jgi:hypothetical protein
MGINRAGNKSTPRKLMAWSVQAPGLMRIINRCTESAFGKLRLGISLILAEMTERGVDKADLRWPRERSRPRFS